jgi:hypothetical protein
LRDGQPVAGLLALALRLARDTRCCSRPRQPTVLDETIDVAPDGAHRAAQRGREVGVLDAAVPAGRPIAGQRDQQRDVQQAVALAVGLDVLGHGSQPGPEVDVLGHPFIP